MAEDRTSISETASELVLDSLSTAFIEYMEWLKDTDAEISDAQLTAAKSAHEKYRSEKDVDSLLHAMIDAAHKAGVSTVDGHVVDKVNDRNSMVDAATSSQTDNKKEGRKSSKVCVVL